MLLNRLKGGFVFRHKHTVLDRSGLAKWQISSAFRDQIAELGTIWWGERLMLCDKY